MIRLARSRNEREITPSDHSIARQTRLAITYVTAGGNVGRTAAQIRP
jgi:hypothetical protein